MKTLTFALQKGGTGKTSVSVSVAVELAKKYRVVFIDADPQGNSSAWIGSNQIKYELADVLNEEAPLGECIYQTEIQNLFLIPTAGIGGGLRQYQESKAMGKPFAIADLLPDLAKVFDYCIIDTSPAFGGIERQCFCAADEVIPVLQLNQFSVDGLKIFTTNLGNAKKDYRLGNKPVIRNIILNARDERIAQQNDNLKIFQSMQSDEVKLFVLPTDQAYSKAQKINKPVQSISSTKKETLRVLEEIAAEIVADNQ